MADPGDLRASDQDRDRAATELREHYAAGRISEPEFDERVQRAYDAGTVGELASLRDDLPDLPASPAEERARHVERRAALRRRVFQQTGGALGAFLICCVIWAATGADYFWPMWVAIGVVVPLARNGWLLYGPAADLDHAEARLDSHDRHGRRHHHRHGWH